MISFAQGLGGVMVLVALPLIPSIVRAGELRVCTDTSFSTDANSVALADLICTAAMDAKALFASCGLTQHAPITIHVVEAAMHPSFGACAGLYNLQTGCLQVTDIDRLTSLLPEGDARASLPPEVLFAGAIAHELAHAFVQQTAGEVEISAIEQEFVANAFEMELMEASWRGVLLAADPVDPSGSLSLVHLSIYALAPRVFGNNAWVLFDRDEFGCSFVQKIVAGEYRFPRH